VTDQRPHLAAVEAVNDRGGNERRARVEAVPENLLIAPKLWRVSVGGS